MGIRSKNDVTVEYLHSRLTYDPETGKLFWKHQPSFPQKWNTRYAHKRAGSSRDDGYVVVRFTGRCYYAHRIAWAIYYGEWPYDLIDHINGDPFDNRISNLRVADQGKNQANSKTRGDGRLKGATYHSGAWVAKIWSQKQMTYLGRFPTEQLAHQAYCDAADRIHGEYARHQ